MSSPNPFRQTLRRRDATYKTYARNGNEHGKDGGSNTDFAIGNDYLWIRFDLSIPLVWITAVEQFGPGFLVAWQNPTDHTEECASFCFLRTGWGYNVKKRDEVLRRLREAVAKAATRPRLAEVSRAETDPACQRCADPNARTIDFTWFSCFLAYSISKSDRRLLCPSCTSSRLRLVTIYNLLIGNLGWGIFASPMISFRNITAARAFASMHLLERWAWILAFLPYAVLAWMAGWSLWTAFNM